MHSLFLATTVENWIESGSIWPLNLVFSMLPAGVWAALIHTTLVGLFFGLPAFVFIWAERKVAGRIQDRLGPTRVGGRFGWLQSLADGVKLIQKEDLAPDAADKMLFRLAPYIVVVASFAAFMFLPFSQGLVAVVMDIGLFIALAVLSIEVLGIVLAGYASGSKWSLFGGMREAAQMVSYEVPLGITAVIPVVVAGSLNLGDIVQMQSGGLQNWIIFNSPFTFLTFFVFFTVTLASNKRAPFDLAEAESELVGGFHTEYSGMRWSFFFLAEYASMFFISALAAILFLGGWWTGIPFIDNGLASLAEGSVGGLYLLRVFGMKVLLVKAGLLVFVQIWIRWTLPRLRIDQVMTTCLKYLLPMSCFLFLASVLWPLVIATVTHGEHQRISVMGSFEAIGERVPVQQLVVVEAEEPVESEPAGEESKKPASEEESKGGSVPVEADKEEKTTSVENNLGDTLANLNPNAGGAQ
ncbi:NADH-quinone oxidoreductase subunit NuoH [Thalassoglobus polymorphus]|uniref:NADH-quinone oxidoreductase subunit H n=1 Tax=Thalassoglobus polymorphus TaxID=2527994 RepID=A0A517QTR2_9PLAN|nr:NADH-quinone oxidoreductase subunit NuoH [Thalassoglobus polymorphus]QDT34968.1 NADH-quinone oxidoreductase subunit H [Thalassoglobus polymorphus]